MRTSQSVFGGPSKPDRNIPPSMVTHETERKGMAESDVELPPRLKAKWMLLSDAERETGMSHTTFWRYRKQGVFGGKRWMNRVLILRADVDRYLKHLESV